MPDSNGPDPLASVRPALVDFVARQQQRQQQPLK
jgi:hypothetical protein